MTIKLTIGGTINLGNYESLRVEVSNDNTDGFPQDRAALVAILDDWLAELGRNDPVATEQIDAWRRRILSQDAAAAPEQEAMPTEQEALDSLRTPEPPAEKPAKTPEKKPAEMPAGKLVCEECGAEITKNEAGVSQLFACKNLCHDCLKEVKTESSGGGK